jgi:hypothetical protein
MNHPGIVAVAITFWIFVTVVSVAGIIQDYRKRQLALEPLRMAIEHGQQLLTVVLLSGIIAPYAAQGSLAVAAWIGERLPVLGGALVSPVGWGCSLLVAWRIMRRALSVGR